MNGGPGQQGSNGLDGPAILRFGHRHPDGLAQLDRARATSGRDLIVRRRRSGLFVHVCRQPRAGSNGSTWVSRMLLPEGSRNEVSIP